MFRCLTLTWKGCAACAFAATLSMAGAAANASDIVIDDRLDDPAPMGVFANDWEGGLFVNGNLFQQGLNNPASGISPGEMLTFDGRWIDLAQSIPFTRTVYFVEPGTPNVVSDILQYTVQPLGGFGRIFGSFTSDGDPGSLGTVPVGTPPSNIWPEGSGDFFFGGPADGAPFMSGVIQTVPEPASILMLMVGGGALSRRRKS